MNANAFQRIEIRPIGECLSAILPDYKRHTNFEILWFTKIGRCPCQRIDHEKYPVKENSVTLIAKGQIHSMAHGFEGYSIIVPFSFFRVHDNRKLRVVFNPFVNFPIELDALMVDTLETIMKMIQREMSTTNDEYIINAYMAAFLYKISQYRSNAKTNYEPSTRLENMYTLLEENFLTQRNAAFYADHMGLTTKRLNEIIKKRIGLTVTQLIHKLLMAEAKRRIGRDQQTLKEIAFDLGFSEQAYFSRFFKKQAGLTPEQFLKSVRKGDE